MKKKFTLFDVINYALLTALAVVTIYPLIYIVAASFSSVEHINLGDVWFYPKGFTTSAYGKVFEREGIWMAYLNSFFYMFVGTAVCLAVTICGAYPLSKKRLAGRRLINIFVVFTMWFSAGVVPTFLNFKSLGLLNSRFGYIIGFACAAYNFILLRTYFASIPESLEEAAMIDGASDFYIMTRIFVPLALPSLATIALFYAVDKWNGYLWAMILITDDTKLPLQVVLKKLIVDMSGKMDNVAFGVDTSNMYSEETVMYATMVFAILPMLVLYPFVQRYFVKGVMLGAVKG